LPQEEKGASKEENQMCEANAYLVKGSEENLFMENVDILRPEGEGVYIQDIFGEQRWLRAHIKELNLVQHRIVLEQD
jgi:predicted RNA-binding protein